MSLSNAEKQEKYRQRQEMIKEWYYKVTGVCWEDVNHLMKIAVKIVDERNNNEEK